MAEKAISDEQIIAALLNNGTIQAAAEAAGVSPRTVYDRMNNGDFRLLYQSAKTDIVRCAVISITGKLQAAIDTVSEIMGNEENNAGTRLQAAKLIIDTAGKFTDRLDTGEHSLKKQMDANRFSLW